jgi:hypothetical protein
MRRRRRPNLVPGSFRGQRIVGPTSPPGVIGGWRGPNLLVDGDMEALGVAAWPTAFCVATKILVAPMEGLQSLRITKTGAASGYAAQNVMTIGQTYRLTGLARGDTVSRPRVFDTLYRWDGSVATTTQEIDITWVASATLLRFYVNLGIGGNYADFDGLYLSLEA